MILRMRECRTDIFFWGGAGLPEHQIVCCINQATREARLDEIRAHVKANLNLVSLDYLREKNPLNYK